MILMLNRCLLNKKKCKVSDPNALVKREACNEEDMWSNCGT